MNAMVDIRTFGFEGEAVRVLDRSGDPWFVLADVCRILEHSNPTVAAGRLDDDERNTLNIAEGNRGNPNATVINESGLYSLVLTSRKPAAKRFKKWVTSEVLPAIRKTGGYGRLQVDMRDPVQLQRAALQLMEINAEQQERLALAEPKAEALDRIATCSDGSLCITDAAKALQLRRKDLFAFLRRNAWIYSRGGQATEVAFQEKLNNGCLEHKVTTITQGDGRERTVTQVRVTAKGLARLSEMLSRPKQPSFF